LQFSLHAASPETFGYTRVYLFIVHVYSYGNYFLRAQSV